MASKPPPNLFERIVAWFKDAGEWVQENLGDPAIARTLREDLGLKPGESLPQAQKDQFRTMTGDLDPDKAAFAATTAEITEIAKALKDLGEELKDDASGQSAWDVAYLIGQVALRDSVRLRFPAVYALLKLSLLISDDPEEVERFDPAMLMRMLRGESLQTGGGVTVERVMAGVALLPTIVEAVLHAADAPAVVDHFHGWDAIPASATPRADQASAQTLTMLVGEAAKGALTVTGVPPEMGGPALMMALGGSYTLKYPATPTPGSIEVDAQIGGAGALRVHVPLGDAAGDLRADGDPTVFAKLAVLKPGAGGQPAFLIGEAGKTRIELGKVGAGIEIYRDRAAVSARIKDGALVVTPGGADSFLRKILANDLRIGFDIGMRIDSTSGFVLDGGTGLSATIPIEKTILDAVTVHHLTLGLGPSGKPGKDVALEVSGAFGLKLGPFQASVDRLGFTLDMAFGEGNLGFVDLDIGFKPPNGIGLLLDASVIKGGGYLYIDPERGEYAGALELKINLPLVKVGIKAIGVLSTRMPDGSDGWALLLLIYGEFPPIQLSWGFTLNALGGMIGLQHGVNVDALIAGMSTGVLDDILFPANPVADAPRIINRLRTVFPVTPRALILGPMVEIGWGGVVSLIKIRMGVILQMDNVLGSGPQPIAFGRVVILGQLAVNLPVEKPSEATFLKLLVDFVGAIEVDPFRIGFTARLRDSYAGKNPFKVDFGGMLVVRAQFGDQPTFVVAAGGFHPAFRDIPPGLPAPIDRLNASFPIGPVKMKIEGYFATTPASVQAGASVSITAKLGPVALDAKIGFDAICYFQPRFRFDVQIYGSAAIKFKGYKLASVDFKFRLEGPGLWRASGYGSFSILFWDVEVPFDESWGAAPVLTQQSTDAAALVAGELAEPGNWTAQMPVGADPLVSVGPMPGVTGVIAHPLGTLTFTQRAIPFDLVLDKIGQTLVAGANSFTIESGFIGSSSNTKPATPLTQHFAVGEFRTLTDAQKLSDPGFQPFTAGARFGDTAYSAGPAAADQTMDYETLYLKPEVPRHILLDRVRIPSRLDMQHIRKAARLGAAAKSGLRGLDRMIPAEIARVVVDDPALAVASTMTMTATTTATTTTTQGVSVGGVTGLRAPALAQDVLAKAGSVGANVAGVQIVEAFELV